MKKERQLIFDKYNGKCAYCGTELIKGWHVDHINAINRKGENSVENYNPSCMQCNIWKSTYTIEQFRKEVEQQVNRLNNYSANYRNAKRYGLITETNIEVKFYFEKQK